MVCASCIALPKGCYLRGIMRCQYLHSSTTLLRKRLGKPTYNSIWWNFIHSQEKHNLSQLEHKSKVNHQEITHSIRVSSSDVCVSYYALSIFHAVSCSSLAASLRKRYKHLQYDFVRWWWHCYAVDVCFVSETWLNKCIPSHLVTWTDLPIYWWDWTYWILNQFLWWNFVLFPWSWINNCWQPKPA